MLYYCTLYVLIGLMYRQLLGFATIKEMLEYLENEIPSHDFESLNNSESSQVILFTLGSIVEVLAWPIFSLIYLVELSYYYIKGDNEE
jgi:hypothetical protein